ncbi:MAG: class I SAM-dependent methyltransferase [Sandaracinaceae bacterium]|nr:class I SAM-dependent methyltransferase [Sandaracinaceae bacterium]
MAPWAARTPWVGRALRAGSLGLVDHLALRTAAIDDAVRDAVEQGAEQLVILGAGLDARAWRMPELAGVRVFEVDHPATQRFKRRRVPVHLSRAREVRFVEVDFERQSLAERLQEELHDPARPTAWIWEGVTMYLEQAATRATLEATRARSAPGSTLAATYGLRDRLWLTRLRRPVDLAFRVLGEPLRGLTEPTEFRSLLEQSGWRLAHDTGPHDWSARYGFGVPALLLIEERLAVCAAGE